MLPPVADAPDAISNLAIEILFACVGVIVGFLSSFALFRARFTAIEKDIEHMKEVNKEEWGRMRDDFQNLCSQDNRYGRDFARRQQAQLEILASIARRFGVQHRITDPGSFTEEENPL